MVQHIQRRRQGDCRGAGPLMNKPAITHLSDRKNQILTLIATILLLQVQRSLRVYLTVLLLSSVFTFRIRKSIYVLETLMIGFKPLHQMRDPGLLVEHFSIYHGTSSVSNVTIMTRLTIGQGMLSGRKNQSQKKTNFCPIYINQDLLPARLATITVWLAQTLRASLIVNKITSGESRT